MTLVTLRPGLTLEAEAAASWARMEAAAGRRLDVNRSTVSRADQFKLYWAYVAYKNGTGPFAVLALHPDQSWHCEPRARAVDTDDDLWIRVRPSFGWRFVVRTEKWHAQYYPHLDQHRGQPAPSGQASSTPKEDDDMATKVYLYTPTNSLVIADHLNKTLRNLGNKETWERLQFSRGSYVKVAEPEWTNTFKTFAYIEGPNVVSQD